MFPTLTSFTDGWGTNARQPIEKRHNFLEDGAQGRNRTTDTVIFSHVLYQLSYLGSRDGREARSSERLP